jgi:hypothetical protein
MCVVQKIGNSSEDFEDEKEKRKFYFAAGEG